MQANYFFTIFYIFTNTSPWEELRLSIYIPEWDKSAESAVRFESKPLLFILRLMSLYLLSSFPLPTDELRFLEVAETHTSYSQRHTVLVTKHSESKKKTVYNLLLSLMETMTIQPQPQNFPPLKGTQKNKNIVMTTCNTIQTTNKLVQNSEIKHLLRLVSDYDNMQRHKYTIRRRNTVNSPFIWIILQIIIQHDISKQVSICIIQV